MLKRTLMNKYSMKINRTMTIARINYLEVVRSKTVFIILIYIIFLLLVSQIFSRITIAEPSKVIIDICLATIEIFGIFLSLFIGITLISKEIEKKSIYTLLSKPLKRSEFIIGKFTGLCLVSLLFNLVMFIVFVVYLFILRIPVSPYYFIATLHIYLKIVVFVSIILALSSMSSTVLTGLLSIGFYLIGNTASNIKELTILSDSPELMTLINLLYFFIPNFEYFNSRNNVVHFEYIHSIDIFTPFVFAILYSLIFLAIAIFTFEQKDIK